MKFKPFIIALTSFVFYFLALPPVNLWFLAFLPPIFWVFLIKEKVTSEDTSTAARKNRLRRALGSFYGQLYLAAYIFWGVSISWLPSPHPAIWVGWALLAGAMSPYFPLFIAASKRLSERFQIPLFLATPIAWVGAEWVRKHFLSGFSLCSLEHALYRHPVMIQTAEFTGEYGVGALILIIGTLFGIGIYRLSSLSGKRRPFSAMTAFLSGLLLLAGMAGYGHFRISQIDKLCLEANLRTNDTLTISLLQDPTYYQFPISAELSNFVHHQYIVLSEKTARSNHPDLIVWPEGTFAYPFFAFEPNAALPLPEEMTLTPEEKEKEIQKIENRQKNEIGQWIDSINTPVLLGLCSTVYTPNRPRTYNSALYCRPGEPFQRYDKRARVMFGEYVPILENFQTNTFLKTLCEPISAGKTVGNIAVGKYTALVSICFESCTARFVRSQLHELAQKGKDADFLINVSNDAWFFGNAENDYHSSTYRFRAVETRKYYLVATHGGISLGITPAGKVFIQGEKGKSENVIAKFTPVSIKPFLNGKGLWVNVICTLLFLISFMPLSTKKKAEKSA